MTKISKILIEIIKNNIQDVQVIISNQPDWTKAENAINTLYSNMVKKDKLWSENTFNTLKEVYFKQRETNKGMRNITLRTLAGMPENLKNDTKKIFLQIAESCCFFNASHKVNFESEELPKDFNEIKMIPAKKKGNYTYAEKLPTLYSKISLTFDYWVPKILEWTEEIRSNDLKDWKSEHILKHDSCTDFMRISLMFLSETKNNPPIAKAKDREKLLELFGEEFVWIKKSAKKEDILANNKKLVIGLKELNNHIGIDIPLEAWSRLLYSPFLKLLIK